MCKRYMPPHVVYARKPLPTGFAFAHARVRQHERVWIAGNSLSSACRLVPCKIISVRLRQSVFSAVHLSELDKNDEFNKDPVKLFIKRTEKNYRSFLY